MTKLLASVMSVEEAQIALDCGADIIDCKDPSTGPLGALSDAAVRDIVELVSTRRPVSSTIGDFPMQPDVIRNLVRAKAATGVDYIKIGIDCGDESERCIEALAPLATQTSLIAVLFADRQPDLGLLPLISRSGFAGVMLDTAGKSNGGLRNHVSPNFLSRFVARAKALDLTTGLAGSLKLEDIPLLLDLSPDYLGFRGALCEAGRGSVVDPRKAATVSRALRSLAPAKSRLAGVVEDA